MACERAQSTHTAEQKALLRGGDRGRASKRGGAQMMGGGGSACERSHEEETHRLPNWYAISPPDGSRPKATPASEPPAWSSAEEPV